MHILESYSSRSRTKICKPYTNGVFYPIVFEKYITVNTTTKFNSRNYDYWSEVLNMLRPILAQHNIKIVQLGDDKEKDYGALVDLRLAGQTSYRQSYHIIQNAILHLGIDSFSVHAASALGKKIVALYSNMYTCHSRPYWSKDEDVILIQAPLEGLKTSYSAEENPKVINRIKPEDVANAVLKLSEIGIQISDKTLYIGDNYKDLILEYVPSNCIVAP